jgi:hypothetical protein
VTDELPLCSPTADLLRLADAPRTPGGAVFFLGAGVDLGFAINPICFLFRLVFYSAFCASSELPKVKLTPNPHPCYGFLLCVHSYFNAMWLFLFRCGAVVVRLFLSRCGPVVLCYDSVQLFLFRFGAFVLVSMQCGYSCGRW